MKRLLLLTIALLSIAPFGYAQEQLAWMGPVVTAGGTAGITEASCGLYHNTTNPGSEAAANLGDQDSNHMRGQLVTDATSPCICKIEFNIKIGAGTPTGSVSAVIYPQTVIEHIGTILGTSSNSFTTSTITSSYQKLAWTFSPCVTLTGGSSDKYFIGVVRSVADDASNYFALDWWTEQDSGYGVYATISGSTGAIGHQTSYDVYYWLYK